MQRTAGWRRQGDGLADFALHYGETFACIELIIKEKGQARASGRESRSVAG